MQKIISTSLWGSNPKYLLGAIENCRLAGDIYPGWKLRIYIDESIPMSFAARLHELGADIRLVEEKRGDYWGAYWRFLVNDEPNTLYIIRDLDSRFTFREAAAVDEWMSLNKPFHIMRDHPNHIYPIQGGMWGGTSGYFNINELISQYASYSFYSCDQVFLAQQIYPRIKGISTVHDEYHEKKPFPPHKPINEGGFVGQIWDEHGVPQPV